MVEMSMLQGVNNMLKAGSYVDSPATDIVIGLATSYISQGVPTLFGQVARAVDPVRRDTNFVDPTNPMPDFIQKPINRAVAKIPFASKTLCVRNGNVVA